MKRSREPEDDLDPDSPAPEPAPERTPAEVAGPASSLADGDPADSLAMRCSLPPHNHPITFTSYGDYESHYHQFHANRCLECHKNFPSDHLLGIHIEEVHDSLVKIRRSKGEHTYSCFVEGCERKCLTHQKRRMHMIDKHMYPKNFFFAVTRDGIDGRRSLLVDSGHHRRRSSASTQFKEARRRASIQEVSNGTEELEPSRKEHADTAMTELTGAMSALQFVPPSVRFGRGRAGFARK